MKIRSTLACILFLTLGSFPACFAQGTEFTYQGRLNNNGTPANGTYDLRFAIYDAVTNGNIIGDTLTNSATVVSNGLFTTTIDFGANVFNGQPLWLDVAVSTNGADVFTELSPRQPITSTPYAIQAANALAATVATSAASVSATNISGIIPLTQLPSSVITNGASGVSFSGTFTGNGAGITNLEINSLRQLEESLVGWGYNNYGQANIPANLTNVVAIVAGYYHNLALRHDGTMVGWGYNISGQANIPAGLSNVVAIAAGGYHSLALKGDGTVVAWGDNTYGQITIPAGLSNVVAIAAGAYHSLALKSDGTMAGWGYNVSGQTSILAGLSNVVTIATGAYHSLALKSDGTVIAWGDNSDGQTTIPAGLSNVVAVAGGLYHSLALKSDGTVVAWGDNGIGETDIPAGLSNVVAISTKGLHNLALQSNGTVVGWGYNGYGQTTISAGLSNVVAIATGYAHSLVLQRTWAPAQLALLTQNNLFQGTLTAAGFNGNGSGLTSLNATNLTGTLPAVSLPATVVTNGASGVSLSGTFSGNGSGLTTLNASQITTGTVADTRLSANVALLNANQNFTGQHNFSQNVGIGTNNPAATLHVYNSGFPTALIDGSSTTGTWLALRNQGGGTNWHIIASGSGNGEGAGKLLFNFGSGPGSVGGTDMILSTTGVAVYGTFNNNSDRNSKQDIQSVSPDSILDEVLHLPVSQWSYKTDPATRHIGPMAQDFYSAFNIGTDDKHIAPIDEGGVALAAIQGLNHKVQEQAEQLKSRDVTIQDLQKQNEMLQKRMEDLEQAVRSLKITH